MHDSPAALEYIRVLVWPLVTLLLIMRFGDTLITAIQKSKVKLSLFGVDIETSIADLERTLTAAVDGALSPKQWDLLEKIWKKGSVSIQNEGYVMNMSSDLAWIRPIRNAGLLMSLPDGKYIEQATELVLTPLGKLLMQARPEISSKSRVAIS